MNANEAGPHTHREDLVKKVVIEETDREERRKRRISKMDVALDSCRIPAGRTSTPTTPNASGS
jgi:hypothetical protein